MKVISSGESLECRFSSSTFARLAVENNKLQTKLSYVTPPGFIMECYIVCNEPYPGHSNTIHLSGSTDPMPHLSFWQR